MMLHEGPSDLSGIALSGSVPHGLAGFKSILERGGTAVGLAPELTQVPALVKEASRTGAVQTLADKEQLAALFAAATNQQPATPR
jgi:chemotaxis response regulator CheB